MAKTTITMDTYKNRLLEGDETEGFLSEEDPSVYKQYKTSRRRQLIFKIAIVGFVGTLLIITVVYFTKLRHTEDGALKACKEGERKFQEFPGKCFSVRVKVRNVSVRYVDSVEACQRECLSLPWCVSVDFSNLIGRCYIHSVRSADVSDDASVKTRSVKVRDESDNSVEACMGECLSLPGCLGVDIKVKGKCFFISARSADVPDDESMAKRSVRHSLEEEEAHRLETCTHYDRVCL